MTKKDATLKITNYSDLQQLFTELNWNHQRRVGLKATRFAGNIIKKEAKSNFKRSTKGFSSNNYNDILSSFKVKSMRKKVGSIIGVEGYSKKRGNYGVFKANWLERGTEKRSYNSKSGIKHNTGSIKGSHFFERAVNSKKNEAINIIEKGLILNMEKLVKKYNKK